MSPEPSAGSALTGFVVEDRDGTRLLTITIPGIVVRILTIVPVVTALGVLHLVAPETPWWPSLVLVLLAVISAEVPDSGAGLVTLAGLVSWWLLAVPEDTVWWALLVATCGLVFHVALAHAAAGPPGATPTWAVVRQLAGRCGLVLLVTTGLAVVVEVAEEWGEPPAVLVGITLALIGILPWLAARRTG
ncbi:hypothetical protein D0Z08_06625 [Nocardioides immobilis]|uniref:Uncharacterized protein n=1 Tax=Nocardioides immobilis TaxID=2049295 RepID=A0A417Y638_9ACTN|nr:hypothetical protein [Nocardioides immobilis]RHW27954.1 hypothetical protein D0Z08_06625 [Nocardioides immobilis]